MHVFAPGIALYLWRFRLENWREKTAMSSVGLKTKAPRNARPKKRRGKRLMGGPISV